MKSFVNFIKNSPNLKINFIFSFIFLSLLPSQNYYNSLNFTSSHPVVKPNPYQFISLSDYPVNITGFSVPYLSAKSAIVIDQTSKAILYQKNSNLKLPLASLTKIMTAITVLENYHLDQLVTIDSVNHIGQTMELKAGEQITVENLLYGLLVQSGNDAAYALANFHLEGELGFIKDMNQKAQKLHLKDTQFQNPAGLDSYGHYTTVHDLAILAAYAMENQTFKKIVSTQTITVFDINHTITHELKTTNKLLGTTPGLIGVKTGWTDLAGECLVTYTKRGNKEIITVILGSLDRFTESTQLIDWTFTNHQWLRVPPTTR